MTFTFTYNPNGEAKLVALACFAAGARPTVWAKEICIITVSKQVGRVCPLGFLLQGDRIT